MIVSAGARVVRAAAVAGVLSGAPSTVHALLTGRDVMAAVRAAGTLLGRPRVGPGVLAHVAVSVWWTGVIAAVPASRRSVASGALAGVIIGAVDLAIARRRYPAIAALPTVPQLLDHAAFGALVAATLTPGGAAAAERTTRRGVVRGTPAAS